MTKGVAAMAQIVIFLIVFVTFFGLYMFLASSEVDNNIKLNLESLQVLKLKSTFYTFNQSLGATWFISTVQSVFAAGEEGLGCGYGDGAVERGFWLQDGGVSKKNFTSSDLANLNDKYNGQSTPYICFPREDDIRDYIISKLVDYTAIPSNINADDVEIERGDPNIDVQVSDNGMTSIFSQQINAKYDQGSISTRTQNTNTVNVLIKKMAESGRNAVANLLLLGDSHQDFSNEFAFFRPFGLTANIDAYMNSMRGRITGGITAANLHPDIAVNSELNELRIYADDGTKFTQTGAGLILRYNATLTYSENPENNKYYYHNTSDNTFSKKPIALKFEVQDSLPAMSCLYWSNYAISNFGRNVPVFFNYNGENDVMCCNGYVFACNVQIDQLPAEHSLSSGQSTSNSIAQQEFCNLILAGQTIQCTANGFDTTAP